MKPMASIETSDPMVIPHRWTPATTSSLSDLFPGGHVRVGVARVCRTEDVAEAALDLAGVVRHCRRLRQRLGKLGAEAGGDRCPVKAAGHRGQLVAELKRSSIRECVVGSVLTGVAEGPLPANGQPRLMLAEGPLPPRLMLAAPAGGAVHKSH